MGGKTLLATKHARVFEKGAGVYACLLRSRRRLLLGSKSGSELGRVSNFRLGGHFVAYVRRRPSGLRVTVRELRRGRFARDATAAVASRLGATRVTDLRLKRNGSVAWITQTIPYDVPLVPYRFPGDELPDYEVGKSDRAGQALLDKGHDITPSSLSVSGATVSWSKGGSTYSAHLD